MSRPVHTLVAYFDDGAVLRRPWRVRACPSIGILRDGPATDQRLALWADHNFYAEDTGTRTHRVERAIIVKRVKRGRQLIGIDWQHRRLYGEHVAAHVVAKYLRSHLPTDDQERIVNYLLNKTGVTNMVCKPQPNGDVICQQYGLSPTPPEITIFRHPTIKELIFSDQSR